MSEEENLEKVVRSKVANLHALAVGITAGILAGGAIFVATNWLILKGGENVGSHLKLLGHYFIGYSVTFVGSIIGFFYAFLTGFIVAFLIARIYNWIVSLKSED